MHGRRKILVVVNPASAAGRTNGRSKRILRNLRRVLGEEIAVHADVGPVEATQAVRHSINDGSELIVAVGGDGTVHHVVNGFFQQGVLINPECVLAVIGSGSGEDIPKNLGLPHSIDEQIQFCAHGQETWIDVGCVSFQTLEGGRETRFFLNECEVGVGGEVVRRVAGVHKMFGGRVAFAFESLRMMFTYRARELSVFADGPIRFSASAIGVTVANGSMMGGGMRLTPDAKVHDGLLDVLIIPEKSVLTRLMAFSRIYRGTHLSVAGMRYFKAKSVKIESAIPTLVSSDGELLGTTPCETTVLKRVLKVKCAFPELRAEEDMGR